MRTVVAICIVTGFYILGFYDGRRYGVRVGINETISEVERIVGAR